MPCLQEDRSNRSSVIGGIADPFEQPLCSCKPKFVVKIFHPAAGTLVKPAFQFTIFKEATSRPLLHSFSCIPAKVPLLLCPNIMMNTERRVGVSLVQITSRTVATDRTMCICVESRKACFFDLGHVDHAFWISIILANAPLRMILLTIGSTEEQCILNSPFLNPETLSTSSVTSKNPYHETLRAKRFSSQYWAQDSFQNELEAL